MEIQDSRAVSVTNISPNANEKTVSDFFSFCGKITKLYLKKDEGTDTSSAVVQFETDSAAKTALLLTNALIIDRPITVLPYSSGPSDTAPVNISSTNEVPQSQITQRTFPVADDQRSKTSVVASLLAAGYVLTNDAFEKAKEVDEKHSISLQAKVALEQVKVKAHEIDVQLGISEKASTLQKQATEKVKQIDEQLHISEKATAAANTIKTTATTVANQVAANPTVAKGLSALKDAATSVKTSVESAYEDTREQTQKAIEEKQKNKKPAQLEEGSESVVAEGGVAQTPVDSSSIPSDSTTTTTTTAPQ